MSLSDFKVRGAEIIDRCNELVRKPGLMTREDEKEFNELFQEFEVLRMEQDLYGPQKPSEALKAFDLQKLNRYERGRLEKIAFAEFIRSGSLPGELKPLMVPQKRAAQQSTSDGSGGYTIPNGFVMDLERAMKDYGGMWENARVIKTDRGNTTSWGYTNDTGNSAYILDEAADGTTSAAAVTFGSKEFAGFKYTSGVMQVSNEVLQDSELFAEEFVNVLSERMFRGTNTHFTTGDGNGKPTGAVTSAIHGRHTSADGDISSDDLLELIYSVNTSYRRRGKLMMHSTTLKHLQNKSSEVSTDKPFWIPPYKAGEDPAGTIWGYPVSINDDMASLVGEGTSADDNKKPILFGDFSKYIIRQARDLRIVRLPQRFAATDETGIVVFMRVDGDIINAGTDPIKYMRVSTT